MYHGVEETGVKCLLRVGIFCKLLATFVLVKRSKEVEVAGQQTATLLVTVYSDMAERL
jgi:hypothetical protein